MATYLVFILSARSLRLGPNHKWGGEAQQNPFEGGINLPEKWWSQSSPQTQALCECHIGAASLGLPPAEGLTCGGPNIKWKGKALQKVLMLILRSAGTWDVPWGRFFVILAFSHSLIRGKRGHYNCLGLNHRSTVSQRPGSLPHPADRSSFLQP